MSKKDQTVEISLSMIYLCLISKVTELDESTVKEDSNPDNKSQHNIPMLRLKSHSSSNDAP